MMIGSSTIDPKYVIDLPEEQLLNISPEFLKQLRDETPVAYLKCMDIWYLSRAEDVVNTMRDHDLFRVILPEIATMPVLGEIFNQGNITPEQYTRIRKGSDVALNPKAMKTVVPNIIIPCIEEQLDKVQDVASFDLLDDFFGPINFNVMKRILGIPHIDNDTLARWGHGLHDSLENLTGDPVRVASAWTLREEIDAIFKPIIKDKDDNPDGSLIAHMLAYAEGNTLEERGDFIMGHVKTILLAGVQEGAHAAVNTIIGLHTSPKDLEKFRSDPAQYVDLALEESVRFLPPVAATYRRLMRDHEIRGVKLTEGANLLCSMSSASRDPEIWGDDGDQFVLERFARDRTSRGAQVGFGYFPRFCQGASFIRNFVHQGLIQLYERYPNIRPDPNYTWTAPFGLLSNYCHLQVIHN